jgi:RNA recognition motif-containing protein
MKEEKEKKKEKKEKKEAKRGREGKEEEASREPEDEEEEPRVKRSKQRKAEKTKGGAEDESEHAKVPPTSGATDMVAFLAVHGEQAWRDNSLDPEYLTKNPDGITRLFCGNLKLDVTEEALRAHIPNITFIKWQKDKTTKQFYGSTFLEMKDPKSAALAVGMDRSKFMGRPLKIYYCPPRPGAAWPPIESSDKGPRGSVGAGGAGERGSGKDRNTRAKTPKPPGGRKLYMGNLSYEIDDETTIDFFKDCGEMRGLRWLVNNETGEFRGGGFVEFTTTEAGTLRACISLLKCKSLCRAASYASAHSLNHCLSLSLLSLSLSLSLIFDSFSHMNALTLPADKAILLDGKELLGRSIRLDWTL